MLEIKYTIQGISALLMHRFSEETYKQSKNANNNLTPREIAEKYLYVMEDGELYIPGDALYHSIMDAGKFHKYGKRMITTAATSLLPSGCIMISEYALLGTKEWEVDSRPAMNNALQARIMCHRPRLDEWQTSFVLQIDPKVFETKLIDQLISDAGSKCGVLSFRPMKKGTFGRYILIGKEIIADSEK
jgi:hypothetical protein